MKRVVPRARARHDVADAIAHYRTESDEAALGFVDALERVYTQIARRPAVGSLRYAHELDLPGLRKHPLRGYPYLVFYVERIDHVDVWRVLHVRRDIGDSLRA